MAACEAVAEVVICCPLVMQPNWRESSSIPSGQMRKSINLVTTKNEYRFVSNPKDGTLENQAWIISLNPLASGLSFSTGKGREFTKSFVQLCEGTVENMQIGK